MFRERRKLSNCSAGRATMGPKDLLSQADSIWRPSERTTGNVGPMEVSSRREQSIGSWPTQTRPGAALAGPEIETEPLPVSSSTGNLFEASDHSPEQTPTESAKSNSSS